MVIEASNKTLSISNTTISVQDVRNEHGAELDAIRRFQRLTDYLVAAQIYLRDNVLLEEPLQPEHIKDRLLGHWGTSPGINLIYAHLNHLITRYDLDMFLVTGPGHGAPANLANLYLEGTLHDFYPHLTFDKPGLHQFVKSFSWPGGFPSHLYPGVPGTIHEGGELGYALATSFGAVMDNPDLIVACIVGDGEAETGPTATAWHGYKFINPAESGAVIPILHLNGYKISNPTIYGTMSDEELLHLFTGYGYEVQFVEGVEEDEKTELDAQLYGALDWAYHAIRRIQQAARSGQLIEKPRWPVILLRTPKGMTGIKELDGEPLEGSFRSHQVPVEDVKTNPEHLKLVEQWLKSYNVHELLDENGKPKPDILEQCPKGDRRMGENPHTFGGRITKPLQLPNIHDFAVHVDLSMPAPQDGGKASSMEQVALYLREVIRNNPHAFRIFSPDELQSNKLGVVLDVKPREYEWPVPPHNPKVAAQGGQVIEVLSEHNCQAWLQGYLMTGRHGLFPTYEAFLNIVVSMMDQFAKFLKLSQELSWRLPFPSLNYLESSTLWEQEHNGFSHQNPGIINSVLNKKASIARVYLPPDANCLVSTMDHCLQSNGHVNLIVSNKQPMPQWLAMNDAIAHCRAGASIWRWASIDEGINPDVVLVGIGDKPTLEVMAATQMLRNELPELRVRVVNVTDLFVLENQGAHPHGLDEQMFNTLFTQERPVIINFHGYPSAVEQLLFGRDNMSRFQINGYREEGTTTTPFDMNVRNGTDRYHVVMQAIRAAAARNPQVAVRANELVSHYEYVLAEHHTYIQAHGSDPKEIVAWKWKK